MRQLSWFAAALMLAVVLAARADGDGSGQAIDRVEEDWQLVVEQPDIEAVGPQITTAMSPVADGSTPFVAFDLNYSEYPSFQPGGMQLQVWSGTQLGMTASEGTAQFNTPGETVTWTQRMGLSGGTVEYQVLNGQSTTWGQFGQSGGNLDVNFATSLADLSSYSPDTSRANSGVTWQSNHVTSLTIVQVRYYSNGSLIRTDSTPRAISLSR
jgi:hypothetical protein